MRTTQLIDPRGRVWSVEIPVTRRERMRGLRDRGLLPPDHAMLFPRCRSVHTFGMRFPITVVFLDARRRVVAVRRRRPGRLARPRVRARSVLECPAGTDLRPGDVLDPTATTEVDRASGTQP
ncbi:MAG: DUF192 domain-containing protein [Actinomycetota bacterium]